jgi:3-oxoadipate enol-lactonase
MQRVRVNDIDIAFEIDGDRAPTRPWLVFGHSLACDHTMWAPQVAAFRASCNLLAFDIRGHGASSAPAGEYTLELLAADLVGLLDALKIERCHYVGLSLGGMIGQVAALRSPLRFASLTLADTTSRLPPDAHAVWADRIRQVRGPQGMSAIVPSTLERWFTAPFRERAPDVVARIAEHIRATPIAGYIGCAHAISRINLTARLENIRCPVLVMVGDQDRGTPPDMAEEIARAIPGARLERLPYAAHLSNLEQPDAFNAALRGFLSSGL